MHFIIVVITFLSLLTLSIEARYCGEFIHPAPGTRLKKDDPHWRDPITLPLANERIVSGALHYYTTINVKQKNEKTYSYGLSVQTRTKPLDSTISATLIGEKGSGQQFIVNFMQNDRIIKSYWNAPWEGPCDIPTSWDYPHVPVITVQSRWWP